MEDEKKGVEGNEDQEFFKDVLDDPDKEIDEQEQDKSKVDDDKDLTEDQKKERSQKNIDAEAKRKRLEQEAKDKKELELKEAKEKEAQDKIDADAKTKKEAKEKQTATLGKQLDDFKKEFPGVELKELDKDTAFKRYIDGKLLGKKDFISLYKEYLEVKSELSGKSKEEVQKNYNKKAGSGTGSSISKTEAKTQDIYTEKEYEKVLAEIPFMSEEDAEKAMEKLGRSEEVYNKK